MAELSEMQEHFRIKSDGELLSLASNVNDLSPESRTTLLSELTRRLDGARSQATKIQLLHGWYTVFVQRSNICFPDKCPNCLRQGAPARMKVSQAERQRRLFYVRLKGVNLEFPFCDGCAKHFKRRSRVIGWPTYTALGVWLVICLAFDLGKLAIYFGAFVLAAPMIALLREGAAVTLGDFGEDWIECRFRKPEYAEAFATANHVVAQNAETIQDELAAAVDAVREFNSASAAHSQFEH